MKACVLYSGGKDSSLMALILKKLDYDVELCTANFGVYDSHIPAKKSAEALGFKHKVIKCDFNILNKACQMIIDDGFPNEGIKFIHKEVVERVADEYPLVADGTRRDDRTPKLNKNQIRSLEDRKNVEYVNLDSFGYKTIQKLVNSKFDILHEKSNKENSSDFEVEIRLLIDELGTNSSEIFPNHYQTRVIGYK